MFKQHKNHNLVGDMSKNDTEANFYTWLHLLKKVWAVFDYCNVEDEKKNAVDHVANSSFNINEYEILTAEICISSMQHTGKSSRHQTL